VIIDSVGAPGKERAQANFMGTSWQRLNSLSERATERMASFMAANARLLALTIGAGVFAYGYQLTQFSFSIDEEVMWQQPYTDAWLVQRRWGMHLLQSLAPETIYPFTTAAVAIVLLSLSAVLLVDRHQTRLSAKLIFCALFVSFPTFAHIQLFDYMGAYVSFALLLVVAAARLVEGAVERSSRLLVPAGVMLAIAVASYQSLLFVFVTVVTFGLTAEAFGNRLSLARAGKWTAFGGIVSVGALVLYYGVDFAWSPRSSGYVEGFFRWGTASTSHLLSTLYRSSVPYLRGTPLTHPTIPTALVPIVGLALVAARAERPALTYALMFALIVSPVMIHLAFGTWMASRSMMALPFAFAGLWYLFFASSAPILRAGIGGFTCYALVLHSSVISRASLAQEVSYRADVMVAERILDLIQDVRPRLADEQTPLAFVGMLNLPRSMLFAQDDTFGGSFWQWDSGNPHRMRLFLQTLGMPITVQIAPSSEWTRIGVLSTDMPVWPDRNCVQFRDGFVIVKLSQAR
jgi:hypothetical protein